MDYTTLTLPIDATTTPETGAVASLYEAFEKLSDARRGQGKRYSLALVLCLVVLAKLAGQTMLKGATEWVRHRRETLAQRFGLSREDMPCQTTNLRSKKISRISLKIPPRSSTMAAGRDLEQRAWALGTSSDLL